MGILPVFPESTQHALLLKAQSLNQAEGFGIAAADQKINTAAVEVIKSRRKGRFQHFRRTPEPICCINRPPHVMIGTITAED